MYYLIQIGIYLYHITHRRGTYYNDIVHTYVYILYQSYLYYTYIHYTAIGIRTIVQRMDALDMYSLSTLDLTTNTLYTTRTQAIYRTARVSTRCYATALLLYI